VYVLLIDRYNISYFQKALCELRNFTLYIFSGTVWACKLKVARSELANICARSERFIGTQGNNFDLKDNELLTALIDMIV